MDLFRPAPLFLSVPQLTISVAHHYSQTYRSEEEFKSAERIFQDVDCDFYGIEGVWGCK